MADREIGTLIRWLSAHYKLPPSPEEIRNWRSLRGFLRRHPHGGATRAFVEGRLPLAVIKQAAAYRARLLAALRSKEAYQLGRLVRSGVPAPRFFAQLGRAAYALGPVFARGLVVLPVFLAISLVLLLVIGGVIGYMWQQQSLARQGTLEPSCDCPHVSAGLLTREWQQECRNAEAALLAAVRSCQSNLRCIHEKLELQTGPDGTLVSGAFCSPISGPDAWPVAGGPSVPPPRQTAATPCTSVTGLTVLRRITLPFRHFTLPMAE